MAYTAYRVLRAPVEKIEDLMDKAISDGWQPLGAPVLVAPDTNMLYQAIAKGSPDGGGGGPVTIVVGDITDAGTVGKSVLLAEDQEEARTAIGAGTSSLSIGTTASTAKAGDYTPPDVTTSSNGLMLAADKAKLDGLDDVLADKASTGDLSALEARVLALETAP